MNRSNPVFFLAFLVSVVALLGGVALAKGGFYIGKHEGDTLHMVEIVFRMVAGETPHIDFVTPIGGLAFAPSAFFVKLGFGIGTASILAQILMAVLFLPAVWWVGIGRLTPGISAFFGLTVMVLLLALVHGEAERSTSISMHYNRWAWAAAYVAILAAMVPPVHPRNAAVDGVIVGAMLAIMAMIKVTYFVAFALPVAIALILTGQRRALMISVLTGALILAGLTLWLGPEYWLAYLGDLLTVTRSDVRPIPGDSFEAILGAPAWLGASIVGVLSVVLLRQSRAQAAGLVLLLLLPGFAYVTWQNFGNDPQWLPLVAVLLLTLVPAQDLTNGLGWNLRNAINLTAVAALSLGAPSYFNLAFSPFRHFGTVTADFAPLLPRGGVHADLQTAIIRADRVDARVAIDIEEMGLARFREGARREETAVFLGENMPTCAIEIGLPAVFDAMARDMEDHGVGRGEPVFVADLFPSVLWLYGAFAPLVDGAPWYYGGLPGYEKARYLLVPRCPVVQEVQTRILNAITERGTENLKELRRNALYTLYEIL
jgi:hypothetical protein